MPIYQEVGYLDTKTNKWSQDKLCQTRYHWWQCSLNQCARNFYHEGLPEAIPFFPIQVAVKVWYQLAKQYVCL
jgi:hypothetical protein